MRVAKKVYFSTLALIHWGLVHFADWAANVIPHCSALARLLISPLVENIFFFRIYSSWFEWDPSPATLRPLSVPISSLCLRNLTSANLTAKQLQLAPTWESRLLLCLLLLLTSLVETTFFFWVPSDFENWGTRLLPGARFPPTHLTCPAGKSPPIYPACSLLC